MKLVLASKNQHKLVEMQTILSQLGLEVVLESEVGVDVDVEETGVVLKEVHFMRDYKVEFEKRVNFIKSVLAESGAKGIVYGNSGGKDSALVGILCKAACDNTVGIILPCTSRRNYDEDTADAKEVAARYNIETRTVDLTPVKEAELKALDGVATLRLFLQH